ncbi:hypothetical protein, variant [Aphanomyces invadans]|uniref:BZIP domain-containing protein n=1 Tax=Aphanomyces invadans TaxID=157072 RepID=A0A024UQX5_9STRA|nr:hypothetical protein, variant [Aphanomyces invadans]ETW08704.1 hypothetical protein, variant [Aphanomyces invadans]|eukprot:XP_008862509.1 hypothetical protein, variant [Aphanomyces invadans]
MESRSMPKDFEELIDTVATSEDLAQTLVHAKRHNSASKATERRREQCRVSQKSFRERKKKEQEGIESTVQSLEEEVQRLEAQKAMLVRCVPLSTILVHQPDFDGGVPTKLVRKYISVFKTGYIPSKRRMSERQEKFLRSIAHESINYNGSIGIQSILSNWERYTNSFASVNMEALSCDVMKTDDGAIVKGVTKSTLKMSRQSIGLFFPNCPEVLKPSLVQMFCMGRASSVNKWCRSAKISSSLPRCTGLSTNTTSCPSSLAVPILRMGS